MKGKIKPIKIRQAKGKDRAQLLGLLSKLDLYYQGLRLVAFWLVEKEAEIIGCVQIRDCGKYAFLAALGVAPKYRGQGIAKKLLQECLPKFHQDIYLYTISPDFFKKFGFEVIKRPKVHLPAKDQHKCAGCQPQKCAAMVKYASTS